MSPEGKVLLSYNFNVTEPGRPLYAWYEPLAELLHFEVHSPTSTHMWQVPGVTRADQMWDEIMRAKREHEAAQKEGSHANP